MPDTLPDAIESWDWRKEGGGDKSCEMRSVSADETDIIYGDL